ncbi:P-loop containing nucleoside triphosphate hydrolase protein [Xylaria castorea]|nr:P-loop containing nucleoside triphosphate hydrolase protein [Xylaria castorea]
MTKDLATLFLTMAESVDHEVALDQATLDELNSPTARVLLDTIDSLRELQIGEIVNLPQIIVVGDQSSGKSSVLEAISGVRFPTKGDVCTRFATELIIRRAQETKIDVRVDAAASGSSHQFSRTIFNQDTLPEIISEATKQMRIRQGSKKGFSRDVLRVEVTGPHVPSLTLVDLPGFFHSETEDQTIEDRKIVRQLANSYMKQPKSIILAVVSANHNLANQIVVEEARRHDPNRERTLGVITKPDLAGRGSQDEKKYLQLAKAQESVHKLRLGWHVLRNRPEGEEQTTTEDRDAEEEAFFRTGAWSTISSDSRGIASLRKKLSRMLLEHIQKTLPGLIEDIKTNLSTRRQALEKLGKPRSETEDLRAYLLEIAEKFQRLARDGVEGRYNDEFFGGLYSDHETRKLRALLRRLNCAFHATLVTKGMDRKIEWEDEDNISSCDASFGWMWDEENVPEYLESFLRLFDRFPKPAVVSESDIREELEQLAAANQGTEFPGLPNGNLGFQLFRIQMRPWNDIADFYLNQVISFAKSFVEELLIHITGVDEQTANAVLVVYVDRFFERKREMLRKKLREILRPYADAYCPPLDMAFHRTLLTTTIRREAVRVASLLEEEFPAAFTEKGGRGLSRNAVERAFSNVEMDRASEFGIEKVIDMTMTHFQISLGAFAQNVVNLAVENCLISDLHTILTPQMVFRMSEERLKELASESEAVQSKRQALQHEVNMLRSGLRKCQQSRPHERTVLPEAFADTLFTPSRGSSSTSSP